MNKETKHKMTVLRKSLNKSRSHIDDLMRLIDKELNENE